ncbi:hypothetical protein ABT063_51135 [Streptomyces sp. NPDC002838]|uniref:hypothetical protein n=1 Tax=Streptomyces sp. NPDC002838 TaxID=3154436 RepID=UPI00331940FA
MDAVNPARANQPDIRERRWWTLEQLRATNRPSTPWGWVVWSRLSLLEGRATTPT